MRLSDLIDTYHVWDARKVGDLLPDEQCIDVTITSPPYWNIKDYGVDNQIGFGQRYDRYLDDISTVFKAIIERTKPTGSLWVISDTFKEKGELKLLPFDISQRLTAAGWNLQDLIIWQKDRTLPWSHQGKLRNIFEYIAFYSKTKRFKYDLSRVREISDLKDYWIKYPERYSPEGKTPTRTWHVPIPRQGSWGKDQNYVRHACPLPPELIRRIVELTTDPGDVVLDPFAGSGSVLATAGAIGRHYVGLDLSEAYREMFAQTVLPALTSEGRRNSLDADANSRRVFAEIILALRALKLAKEVVRLGRDRLPVQACGAIVVLPAQEALVRYLFVFLAERQIPKSFEEGVRALFGTPPLSKYGIKPEVQAMDGQGLARTLSALRMDHSTELSVYLGGRFYRRDRCVSAGEVPGLLEVEKNGAKYPLIISPLNLQIDPLRSTQAIIAQNGRH